MATNEKKNNRQDEIDLTFLLKVVLKRKIPIILGTVLITVISIIISLIVPKVYESNGFLILSQQKPFSLPTETRSLPKELTAARKDSLQSPEESGITLVPRYKSYFQNFSKADNFWLFLQNSPEFQKRDDKTIIKKRFKDINPEDFISIFSPVYAYSKKDMEVLAQINKDIINYVVGIRIKIESSHPEQAQYLVNNFGGYIRNSMLNQELTNYINTSLKEAKTSFKEYEIDIIENKFNLRQLQIKKKDIEAILKNYPDSKNIELRQVVSVEKGGNIYLSPITQIVGIESLIAELNRTLERQKREKEIEKIKIDFFNQAKKLTEKLDVKKESKLLIKIRTLKETEFQKKDKQLDKVKQVFNELTNTFENYHNKYYEKIRFSSVPEIPEKHIKPKKRMIVILTFCLAFLFWILLAFVMEWWENNRKKIIGKEKK